MNKLDIILKNKIIVYTSEGFQLNTKGSGRDIFKKLNKVFGKKTIKELRSDQKEKLLDNLDTPKGKEYIEKYNKYNIENLSKFKEKYFSGKKKIFSFSPKKEESYIRDDYKKEFHNLFYNELGITEQNLVIAEKYIEDKMVKNEKFKEMAGDMDVRLGVSPGEGIPHPKISLKGEKLFTVELAKNKSVSGKSATNLSNRFPPKRITPISENNENSFKTEERGLRIISVTHNKNNPRVDQNTDYYGSIINPLVKQDRLLENKHTGKIPGTIGQLFIKEEDIAYLNDRQIIHYNEKLKALKDIYIHNMMDSMALRVKTFKASSDGTINIFSTENIEPLNELKIEIAKIKIYILELSNNPIYDLEINQKYKNNSPSDILNKIQIENRYRFGKPTGDLMEYITDEELFENLSAMKYYSKQFEEELISRGYVSIIEFLESI